MLSRRDLVIEIGERERKDGAASRRFPVSVSSETPVPRRGWGDGGDWTEVLSHARGAVDLSRAPLPVLEGHDRTRVNIGVVDGLRIDGDRLRGDLRLGSSQRATELAQDIADGIVRNLSVGYTIERQERDEKKKRITATRWTPHEVSIVSVPADTSVGIGRSHMDPQDPATTTTPPPAPVSDEVRAAEERARLTERERVRFIEAQTQRHRLGADFARDLIDRGVSLDHARAAILDQLATRSEGTPIDTALPMDDRTLRGPATPGDDAGSDFRRAAVDAILIRSGLRVDRPHAAAVDVSASVYDLARLCLSRDGKRAGFGNRRALLERAMTTSDFPAILSDSMHKALRNGWETEPASHREWVRVVPVQDFRLQHRPIIGAAPGLDPVYEHGEYNEGPMSDEESSYKVTKFGKIVSLSWEALQNDDLGAFLRVQPAMGQAARRIEADQVYALFAANAGAGPAMQDGLNLFDPAHLNATAAGGLAVELLSAGRALLRKQKALNGGYMSLVPRYWIVPAERESAAEVVMANATRRMVTEKAEPEWIASLTLVVEPRLAANVSYLAADNGQIDTVELGILEGGGDHLGGMSGGPGPTIEEDRAFTKDVVRWKVRHVFGTAALDWRGLVLMPITG